MDGQEMLEAILSSLQPGIVRRSVCGRRWTAVEAEVDGVGRCGLAATLGLSPDAGGASVTIDPALSGIELAQTIPHAEGPQASLAAAALNALLPRQPERWEDARVEAILRERGGGRAVAMVGHFPFADDLRPHVGSLTVLEQRPRPGDLPEEAAADILPASDLIVITGLAVVNRTLPRLLALCPPQAYVILEAEAEGGRVLGLVEERRVVEPQLLERVAQLGVLVRVHGVQPREHHRLDLFEARQWCGARAPVVGERVADRDLGDLLHAGDHEAHHRLRKACPRARASA